MIAREAFQRLVREHFDPILIEELGFGYGRRAYFREPSSKLRQSIAFDLQRETRQTFRVLLGLNSKVVSRELPADEAGAYFVQYLTKSGVVDFPRNWPCHNEPTARRSLSRIGKLAGSHICPWLDKHESLSDFANLLSDQYELLKGKLFLEAGDRRKARDCLESYRRRLKQMAPTPRVAEALEEVDLLLAW